MKAKPSRTESTSAVRWFADLTNSDVASVGRKNESLGEMIRALKKEKMRVPDGFATTAEDLPDASFAGQQENVLNVKGEDDLMEACLQCYASLFTNRAISYGAG